MADHYSHDIYTLIHSLTPSEWSTLIHEVGNSPASPLAKGKTPKYIEIIKYLKAQPKFDDLEAKIHFGYGTAKPAKWRDAKRNAMVAILKAIDRASENQSVRYTLQKAPIVIQKLIEKELWKRAEKTANKFVKTAEELEQFEILSQLLNLKQLIVNSTYPKSDVVTQLRELQTHRNQTRAILQNIDLYHDIRYIISGFARQNDLSSIREIYDSKEMKEPVLHSNRSKRIYLQTWQMSAFCLGLQEEYLNSIQKGIEFCEPLISNPEEFDHIDFFIKLHFEKSLNNIWKEETEELANSILKLETLKEVKNLPNSLRTLCSERLLHLRLLIARSTFSKKNLLLVIKEMEKWYVQNNAIVSEDTLFRLAFIGADSLFQLGEYSLAVKWLVRIRQDKQSTFRPLISSAAWVLYLLIRFEQEEWDILTSQIRNTRKYLEKYEYDNEYYWELLLFFEKAARLPGDGLKSSLSSLQNRVQHLRTLPKYARLESYFNYSVWIESKLQNRPFLTLYKEFINTDDSPI